MTLQENNHIALIDGDDRHGDRRTSPPAPSTSTGIDTTMTARSGSPTARRRAARARRRAVARHRRASSPPTRATARAARAASPSSTRTAASPRQRRRVRARHRPRSATIPRAAPTPRASSPRASRSRPFGDERLHLRRSRARLGRRRLPSDTGGDPELLQVLPSGVGPEGFVAIPSRNLFVTANEVDLAEDGLARVACHALRARRRRRRPIRRSSRPTATARRSAGARSPVSPPTPTPPGILYAVSDSVSPVRRDLHDRRDREAGAITSKLIVTRDGAAGAEARPRGHRARRRGRLLARLRGQHATARPACALPRRCRRRDRGRDRLPAALLARRDQLRLRGRRAIGSGDDTSGSRSSASGRTTRRAL